MHGVTQTVWMILHCLFSLLSLNLLERLMLQCCSCRDVNAMQCFRISYIIRFQRNINCCLFVSKYLCHNRCGECPPRSTSNRFIAAIRAHIKFRMVFYNSCYYFWGQHCCWTCKCEKNDYYGCAFTLNSSKQFWTRDRSKPWVSAGGSKRAYSPPGNWD